MWAILLDQPQMPVFVFICEHLRHLRLKTPLHGFPHPRYPWLNLFNAPFQSNIEPPNAPLCLRASVVASLSLSAVICG
jgi:hypothetical protein